MAEGKVRLTLNVKVDHETSSNCYTEDDFRKDVLENLPNFDDNFYNNVEVEVLDVQLDEEDLETAKANQTEIDDDTDRDR